VILVQFIPDFPIVMKKTKIQRKVSSFFSKFSTYFWKTNFSSRVCCPV